MAEIEFSRKIRAVVIDDSSLVRNIIIDLLQSGGDIEVIASGKTGIECLELAEKYKPDVITLDIEMPIMDGLTALEKLKQKNLNIAVIMLSVLTQHGANATFKALELGAIDFVPKPSSAMKMDLSEIGNLLKAKILGYFEAEVIRKTPKQKIKVGFFPDVKKLPIKAIAIGTSTGGPNALHSVFKNFPEDFSVPIFVVQHMPQGFTKAFAERLDEFSKIKVKEAVHGEIIEAGVAYIAPGNFHMKLVRKENSLRIETDQETLVNGHRPSVDVTFDSLRALYGNAIVGVIMTGMGRDGADSMKRLKEAGCTTIAQDEKTSVIYGMNRQAIETGGIDYVVPLNDIVPNILRIIKERGI